MSDFSGAWRPITKEQAIELKAQGANVDWIEGAGYIVYDQQALDEFKAASETIRAQHARAN